MLSAEADSKPRFVQALWNAIKQTAGSMQDYHSQAKTVSEHTELHTPAEGAEAQRLALLLVEVMLAILHQSLAARTRHVAKTSHLQTCQDTAAHETQPSHVH